MNKDTALLYVKHLVFSFYKLQETPFLRTFSCFILILLTHYVSATTAFSEPDLPLPETTEKISFAEDAEPVAAPSCDEVLLEDMQGLILLGDPSLLIPCPDTCTGVQCLGVEAPGGNAALMRRLEPLFLHKPLTQNCINRLKREIILYYRAHHHPLVMVLVPEQRVDNRVLQLIIVEACLGKVIVEGNCFSPPPYFCNQLTVRPGQRINERILLEDVSWMNTNPFRRVNVMFTPGEENGTTDIILRMTERRPWRIYAGADNTGTQQLSEQRFFIGTNIVNVFRPDNIFSYQYTTSPNFNKFQSHTFQFVYPLPCRDTLSFFGGYATANPDIDPFFAESKTSQMSGRYTNPQWWAIGGWLSQFNFDIGYDYKTLNSNLFFGEDNLPVTANTVWINQFVGGIQCASNGNSYRAQTGFELFWSPGQLMDNQSDADYNSLRPGATAHYFYGKIAASYEVLLPYCACFWVQGRLQLANANLLASEQFSLGGYNTVRGYNERIVNGDNAYCLNLELRTHPFHVINYRKLSQDSLVLLTFLDLGQAWDHEQIPGFPKSQFLAGIGCGLRYHVGPNCAVRIDFGYPLHEVQGETLNGRIHFSAILSY